MAAINQVLAGYMVAASTGSAVYWRIHATAAGTGTTWSSIAEVEMRATVGGADQCTGGTVFYDSQFDTTTNAAINAFDDSSTTIWYSTDTAYPHWIGYQFASAVSVAQLSIQATTSPGYAPKDFTLQKADSLSGPWTTVLTVTGNTWTSGQIKLFTVP